MNRVAPLIFIIAFTTITGLMIVALLTMDMSEPIHFFGAAGAGAVIALVASILISRRINA
jgi:hypothetical protein